MKKHNIWKKTAAFTFALALAGVYLPLTVHSPNGIMLSASAEEAETENSAILAYLDELCKFKYEYEDDEIFKDFLYSEKAWSAYEDSVENSTLVETPSGYSYPEYDLKETLRGITAKGNTNTTLIVKPITYVDFFYDYEFYQLGMQNVRYIVTEEEYQAFAATQPKPVLHDTYEVANAEEFLKALNDINTAEDDITRTIRLTADITDCSGIMDGYDKSLYLKFCTKAVLDLNGFLFSSNPDINVLITSDAEDAELTITDTSADGTGRLFIWRLDSDAGKINVNAGTFKVTSVRSLARFSGFTAVTGGRFISDASNKSFDLEDLDQVLSLGYEAVEETTDDSKIYTVRRADTDITTYEQLYAPILSAVKERLENGFANYIETDTPVSGAFTEPQDEIMQFSAMWYLPFGDFTTENTGYALMDIDHDGRDELIMGGIDEEGNGTIFDIYTSFKNRAWHVAAANERNSFRIGEREQIQEQGSNGASDSYIAAHYLDDDKLYNLVAYKTENGKTYTYQYIDDDYKEKDWVETDVSPEEDEFLDYELVNVKLTPFSEYQSDTDANHERVLIHATIDGDGQIASSSDGSEPVFDDEHPYQLSIHNAVRGTIVKLTAKADKDWTFKEWKNVKTGETYSTDAAITIEAKEALELTAVFELNLQNIASDEKLLHWVKIDYEKKTGVAVYPEYTSMTDNAYEIAVKDKDGNVLDTYTIDPKTGMGENAASAEVNLPQTGVTSKGTAAAIGSAVTAVLAGLWMIRAASLRKDEKSSSHS